MKAAGIEDAPSFGVSLETAYILGSLKIGEEVRILLGLDRLLSGDGMSLHRRAA